MIASKDLELIYNDCLLVVKKLHEYDVKIKLTKCEWFRKRKTYLGLIIDGEGFSPFINRIEKKHFDYIPTTKKQVQRLCGYINSSCINDGVGVMKSCYFSNDAYRRHWKLTIKSK